MSDQSSIIKHTAGKSLNAIEKVGDKAIEQLSSRKNNINSDVVINQIKINDRIKNNKIGQISSLNRRDLNVVSLEPIISRVEALDVDDNNHIYYISKVAPPAGIEGLDGKIASYGSKYGRLAAANIGTEVELNSRESLLVQQKISLNPKRNEIWDSIDSSIEGNGIETSTISSLRKLLKNTEGYSDKDKRDIKKLISIAMEGEMAGVVSKGKKRKVIRSANLREQAILDEVQDKIFRLPINKSLFLMGPPGTGKTTTLIKRLGQKLEQEYLTTDEIKILEKHAPQESREAKNDWVMFTPTELLRLYVKEAFNRENIPAPDERIKTWVDFSRDLSRNTLSLLRSGSSKRGFALTKSNDHLKSGYNNSPREWYDDFELFFHKQLNIYLLEAAKKLAHTKDNDIANLGKGLNTVLKKSKNGINTLKLKYIYSQFTKNGALQEKLKKETERVISQHLIKTDGERKDFLKLFILKLKETSNIDASEDEDIEIDDELDDGDEYDVSKKETSFDEFSAIREFQRLIKKKAVSVYTNRKIKPETHDGVMLEWLDEQLPNKVTLSHLGEMIFSIRLLNRFKSPHRLFFTAITQQYRRFRRGSLKNKKWYKELPANGAQINQCELDILILLYFKNIEKLKIIARSLPGHSELSNFLDNLNALYRTQVLVDEATDFSPIQFACMRSLCRPGINSFFAAGDFKQRLTVEGLRNGSEVKWADKDIDIMEVNIGYRQSEPLQNLAKFFLSKEDTVNIKLPEDVIQNDIPPSLKEEMLNLEDISEWLTKQIIEVERLSNGFPTIGVLVNSEEEVDSLTPILNKRLNENNLNAVACSKGERIGSDSDVRVFDVQHVKGLEFEAVFFIGVDQLANQEPKLWKQYLYVGSTRAATFLGLHCYEKLPNEIVNIKKLCVESWPA